MTWIDERIESILNIVNRYRNHFTAKELNEMSEIMARLQNSSYSNEAKLIFLPQLENFVIERTNKPREQLEKLAGALEYDMKDIVKYKKFGVGDRQRLYDGVKNYTENDKEFSKYLRKKRRTKAKPKRKVNKRCKCK
jgi:HD-GYP domain-containing protein (c-di-GMP phosphodiesterase class II)